MKENVSKIRTKAQKGRTNNRNNEKAQEERKINIPKEDRKETTTRPSRKDKRIVK